MLVVMCDRTLQKCDVMVYFCSAVAVWPLVSMFKIPTALFKFNWKSGLGRPPNPLFKLREAGFTDWQPETT